MMQLLVAVLLVLLLLACVFAARVAHVVPALLTGRRPREQGSKDV